MIRVVLIASIVFLPAAVMAGAPRTPPPPPSSQPPQAPRGPGMHFDLDIDVPDLPEMMEGPEIPDLREQLKDLDQLRFDMHGLFADRRRAPPPPPDDEDNGNDEPDDPGPGVHVYKMTRPRIDTRFTIPRVRGDEDESDERDASAKANGHGSASLQVKGPVTFQVRAQAGDLEVVSTDRPQVSVTVTDAPADEIALYAFGDRVEPSFRGRRVLRRGKLHVELPRGSRLDVSSMSGDVSVQKLGDVRVRTLSGDVKIAGVAKSDVQSISGDVRIDDSSGPVRLHLVSGRATVVSAGPAPQVEFQSASGSLEWSGVCGKDCHVSAETVSGDVLLAVDPRSSFELSYTSHSGELRDELSLDVKRAPSRKHGMFSGWLEATYGKGEGVIEADAFSGNLVVKKR